MAVRSDTPPWWLAIPLGVAAIALLTFATRNLRDDRRGGPGKDQLYFC